MCTVISLTFKMSLICLYKVSKLIERHLAMAPPTLVAQNAFFRILRGGFKGISIPFQC